MPDLPEVARFDSVPYLEPGGAYSSSADNGFKTQPTIQFLALINRTFYNLQQILKLVARVSVLEPLVDVLRTQIAAIQKFIESLVTYQDSPALVEIASLEKKPSTFLVTNSDSKISLLTTSTLSAIATLTPVADRVIGTDSAGNIVFKASSNPQSQPTQSYKVKKVHLTEEHITPPFSGTGLANIWMTRRLNVISPDFSDYYNDWLTLDPETGIVILQPGEYSLEGIAVGTMVDKHRCQILVGSVAKLGLSIQTVTPEAIAGQSFSTTSVARVSSILDSPTEVKLQHKIGATMTNRSFGAETGFTEPGFGETYAILTIEKMA